MMESEAKPAGTLYGIGMGPGAPDLVTVRGLNIIESVSTNGGTVFIPAGRLAEGSLAEEIARNTNIQVSNWRKLEFPMTGDGETLRKRWRTSAETVAEGMTTGSAAFLTLGDPSVYSTWIYLRREITRLFPRIECITVPGIQTMNAAAAALEVPLAEGKEKTALLPAPDNPAELDGYLPLFDTLVLYKVGHRLSSLRRYLTDRGLEDSAFYVERLGFEDEVRCRGMSRLPDSASGYLSTVIIKTGRSFEER